MEERSRPIGPLLWCAAAAVLFGASTPVAKILVGSTSPFLLAGLLYLGAAAAVVPFCFRGGSPARRWQRDNLRYLAGAVLFGGVLGPVLLLASLQLASASSVSLWLNLESVATALLAGAFFREHLDRRTWVAVGLVCTAGLLLAWPFSAGLGLAGLLAAAACFCWGLDNNATSLIDGFTPAQSTAVKGLVAGAVNLGIGLLLAAPEELPVKGELLVALAAGALGYGASLVLYVKGAQQLGATRSQLIFAAAPFVGVVLAWLALGEPVLAPQLAAGGLMLAGIGLMLSGGHGHEHSHVATTHTHSHRHDDGHHAHSHEGLAPGVEHTHEHEHAPSRHSHPHEPDLHHRHDH